MLSRKLVRQPNRIEKQIDDSHRFTMRGSLHRLATSEYDQGRAEESLRIERLTLVLKPSDTQAAELDGLLGELRYPNRETTTSGSHPSYTPTGSA